MRHTTILTLALLLAVSANAQMTYDVDFTQTREMKATGKTVTKKGHLVFDGKEQLSMLYSDPSGEYFNVDGKNVRMNLNGKKTEVNADKAKTVGVLRSTLLSCLAGQWEEAAQANNAESAVNESKGTRTVTLTAKGKVQRGGYSSVELTYRTSDGHLTKMVLEEQGGIKNTYEIAR